MMRLVCVFHYIFVNIVGAAHNKMRLIVQKKKKNSDMSEFLLPLVY